MSFKVEVKRDGMWDDNVGHDNDFDTEDDAAAVIPSLARIFECAETEFRVVNDDSRNDFGTGGSAMAAY